MQRSNCVGSNAYVNIRIGSNYIVSAANLQNMQSNTDTFCGAFFNRIAGNGLDGIVACENKIWFYV